MLLAACKTSAESSSAPTVAPTTAPQPDAAAQFVERVNDELRSLWTRVGQAEWAKSTNITDATEAKAATVASEAMAYQTNVIGEAKGFIDEDGDPSVQRQLRLLTLSTTLPAPDDHAKREELAGIVAKLEGMYGKGKYCPQANERALTSALKKIGHKGPCADLGGLSDVIAKSHDERALRQAWAGWRTIAVPMRPLYTRFVELGNEGATQLGFHDVGALWRSNYDMPPQDMQHEIDRLWHDVKPLYDALHCRVRTALRKQYGKRSVPEQGPIPAHLLGNMWAQDWSALYPMLLPHPGEPSIDITQALVAKQTDPKGLVRMAEGFFTSLGLNPLPETFWERSLFEKPKDREVVCHASAWDVDFNNDLRLKMCIKIDHEDFVTVHHELGHLYYYNNYYTLPVLFQAGANDGFHEAIGDAIALSMTPQYLQKIGLLEQASASAKSIVNKQMQDALAKVAFLPFGLVVDAWRWKVFAGEATPETYNATWWQLRREFQGIDAPMPRDETSFDPGAKYHVPANTPYMRYFLAHIYQFQFHKALCDAAGHQGPLYTCSIFGSKAAGEKLAAMLSMGATKPWPDALEALAGTRNLDAGPLLAYFEPLRAYLAKANRGQTCARPA